MTPVGAIGLLLLAAAPLTAQQPALGRAFELERQGSFTAAAQAYEAFLASHPADPAALLGLERALVPLGRSAELITAARAATAADSTVTAAYGVLVRTWVGQGQLDSARAATARWVRLTPGAEPPYRELVGAELARGEWAGAATDIAAARQRLRQPDALAPEAAQVAVAQRDWSGAVPEWLTAIRQLPGLRFGALAAFAPAPPAARAAILGALTRAASPEGRRLAGMLQARWGDPVGGFRMLVTALPSENVQAVERLNQFVEELETGTVTPAARRATGMALEATAVRLTGAAAARARGLAAQAYADGGDREAAQRMVASTAAGVRDAPDAVVAQIGLLADDGKPDEAARRLAGARGSLTADEALALTRRIAWAWARLGQLARAEQALSADSTVEGLAVSGRIAILQGHVKDAVDRLRAAGPYTGTREEAAGRASLLALLQRIEPDTLPALGAAMLKLEQADTAGAVGDYLRAATQLTSAKGGAELRLVAGRLELARGRTAEAERLLRAADDVAAPATAPAAELELGRLLIALSRRDEAVATLEHMIVTYATSALVPQARRALDEARGAIPKT